MDPTLFQPFCLSDKTFFDTPARLADTGSRFEHADRAAPPGWERTEKGLWVVLGRADVELPAQGWKIHVSATPDQAPDAVATVWDYCIQHGVAFKFLRSAAAANLVNGKDSHRGGSGKLVAIYPVDTDELTATLAGLAGPLVGVVGPYILSDLRYGDGPLYVRYGGFTESYTTDAEGEPEPAMWAPDGTLVPDRRDPVFTVPDWVPVPEILRESLAARRSGATNFPYDVKQALHFSNGGGVYLAVERATGVDVVLREARPHAALDRDGVTAIERLRREHVVLTSLAGLDCVPRVLGYYVAGEHHFLAEEYIEGPTLLDALLSRYPFVRPDPTHDDVAEYLAWTNDVLAKVEHALNAVHGRGVRFGDLHPNNILLRDDGSVVLIDFEVAGPLDDVTTPALQAPGFAPPKGVTGADVDRYALESLRLFLLLPLTQLVDRNPVKALTLGGVATGLFPAAAPQPGAGLVRYLQPEIGAAGDSAAALFLRPHWPVIRDSLVAGIIASATPDRRDRLFPGGPAQFITNGVGLRTGAAGVLLAMHGVGARIPAECVDWLVATASRTPPSLRAGLYDGLHGVALVLDLLGRTEDSREILALARSGGDRVPVAGMLAGRAGIALALLHFAHQGEHELFDAATDLADGLAAYLTDGARTDGLRPPTKAGLLGGMTGVALLFLHLYQLSGDQSYLDLAYLALQRDLEHCVLLDDGIVQVRDGSRHLGYLDAGSGGIAVVAHEYLRHREDAELAGTVRAIRRSFQATYVFQPGLLHGRAGVIAMLRHLDESRDDQPLVLDHVRRMGWHALSYEGELAFPGALLQRLSMDLATGSAGILLALRAVFEDGPTPVLPFLDTRSPVATTSTGGR